MNYKLTDKELLQLCKAQLIKAEYMIANRTEKRQHISYDLIKIRKVLELLKDIDVKLDVAEHDCYCGEITTGDVYDRKRCDLGCMYPGA